MYTKGRWLNKPIIDVFEAEYKAFTKEYYINAIESGNITVNGKKVAIDYVLKNNDLILHEAVRKELPVYNVDIPIVYEDEKLLVVNKPVSMPIHVCGAYNFNTVLNILKEEKGYGKLHTLHRLDRVTSGILLLGKSDVFARKAIEEISVRNVTKVYYARVEGIVTKDFWTVDKPIYCISYKEGIMDIFEGEIEESKPIEPVIETEKRTFDKERNKKLKEHQRLKQDKEEVKTAYTEFRKIWSDEKSNTSLIECHPKTGRTHQLRLHLRYSGHPIVNDLVYDGKSIGNLYKNILEKDCVTDDHQLKKKNFADFEKNQENDQTIEGNKSDDKQMFYDQENIQNDYTTGREDKIMEIWLHAKKYTLFGKEYETEDPYWANKELEFKQFTPPIKKTPVLFVTGNPGKLKEFKAITGHVFQVEQLDIDMPEYQGTPEYVASEKCKHAFKECGKPLITEDTSLCFNAYNGLPGVYIKWFLKELKPEGLYKMASVFDDTSAYAQCIFSYIESADKEPIQFVGRCDGQMVEPRGATNFGWDPCFQPDDFDETFAEMKAEVKNTISHRSKALAKQLDYFKNLKVQH